MCTKNEKTLALFLSTLCDELRENGVELSDKIVGMLPDIQAILDEEESAPKQGKGADDRFYYTGCEVITMTQEERNKLGICEFTVTYRGEQILHIYWDTTLEWIMQPCDDGESFQPTMRRKFPGQAYARSFLKKLAEEELAEPGTFAKKYYISRPTVIVRKKADEAA